MRKNKTRLPEWMCRRWEATWLSRTLYSRLLPSVSYIRHVSIFPRINGPIVISGPVLLKTLVKKKHIKTGKRYFKCVCFEFYPKNPWPGPSGLALLPLLQLAPFTPLEAWFPAINRSDFLTSKFSVGFEFIDFSLWAVVLIAMRKRVSIAWLDPNTVRCIQY